MRSPMALFMAIALATFIVGPILGIMLAHRRPRDPAPRHPEES